MFLRLQLKSILAVAIPLESNTKHVINTVVNANDHSREYRQINSTKANKSEPNASYWNMIYVKCGACDGDGILFYAT